MTAAATPAGVPAASTRALGEAVTTTVEVPATHSMAELLGPRDAHLRTIERAVPEADVHVRGNVVSIAGPALAVACRRHSGVTMATPTPMATMAANASDPSNSST